MRTIARIAGVLVLVALPAWLMLTTVAHGHGTVGTSVPAPSASEPPSPRITAPSFVAGDRPQVISEQTAEQPPGEHVEDTAPADGPLPDLPPTDVPPPVPDDVRPPDEEPPIEVTPPDEEAPPDPDWRPEPEPDEILIDADQVHYVEGAIVARGNVVVLYRGFTITSETAEIDEDGVLGRFRDDVTIRYDDREVVAEVILFNFEDEEWEVLSARTVVEPEFFERGVAEPIYVYADRIAGTEDEEEFDAFDALATSCELDLPHYGLRSDHVRVIDDSRLVLRRPTLEIFGRTILRYPWDVTLSQRTPHNRFFPEFGQNTVEGFYAKMAYLYLTEGDLDGFIRVHLTEKRGIGAGADHRFDTGAHRGEASLFYEPDQGALNTRVRHHWDIDEDLTSNLNLSLQRRSGFTAPTTSLSGNLSVRHFGDRSRSSIGLDRSMTDTAFATSSRFGASFDHRQEIGAGASWNLRSVLRRTDHGADRPSRETLRADFRFNQRRDWYDWSLAVDDEWYLTDEEQRSFGIGRLPEIVFNTDSRRLGDWRLFGAVPFRTSFRTGNIVQYPEENHVAFATLDSNFGGERIDLAPNVRMTSTLNFNQAFYSPEAARYILAGTMGIDADLGSDLFARLSHRAGTVDGLSPLRRDFAGVYNTSSLSVVHQVRHLSRFELTGGYDFVDDRWREVRLRGWMTPSRTDRIELLAGYVPQRDRWRALQVRWTHATPWEIYLALSTRYSIERGELESSNLEFDWRLDDLWRFQGIALYSGHRNELRNMNLRVTRDLHCWIASLTYNHDLNELRLNLGIKAFPFEDRDWTLAGSGARLGSHQQYYY